MTFEEVIEFVEQKRRTSVVRIFFGDADDYSGTEKAHSSYLQNFVWINYKCKKHSIEKLIAQFEEVIDAKDFAIQLKKHFSDNHIDAKVIE